jgi:AcrR family transcriptional regulator
MKLTMKALQLEFEDYKSPQSQKEKDIVSAAEDIFADFGYEGATTSQLAKKAGVTERTLFKYFPTKLDLYNRILAGLLFYTIVPSHMADLKQRLQSRDVNFKTWYISILTARYEAISKEPKKLRLLLGAILFSHEFAAIFGNLWKENLYNPSVDAIRYYQKIGEIREDLDAEQITRASYSLGAGFLVTKFVLAPKHPIHPMDEISCLFKVFYNGIVSNSSKV